jgi:hypothetical protein
MLQLQPLFAHVHMFALSSVHIIQSTTNRNKPHPNASTPRRCHRLLHMYRAPRGWSRVGRFRHTNLSRTQHAVVVDEAALELGDDGAWFHGGGGGFEHGAVDVGVKLLVERCHFGDALPLEHLCKREGERDKKRAKSGQTDLQHDFLRHHNAVDELLHFRVSNTRRRLVRVGLFG